MTDNSLKPAIISIFGITGDLARRYLLPALYHLAKDGLLPETVKIVGITRRQKTVEELLNDIRAAVEAKGDNCDQTTLEWLAGSMSVVSMDLTEPSEYARLKSRLDEIEDEVGLPLNRLFYLSIPSTTFEPVVRMLGEQGLNQGSPSGKSDSRLLIEKPFGYDLQSAKDLIDSLQTSFTEDQIYRIDHYLAKETTQNILTFRFENPLFSGAWDNRHVSHIMITAAEAIGIEGRVGFYEQMGAMRDLIQSHLLQLLALVTMERPKTMKSDQIHAVKEALFDQIMPPAANEMGKLTVRGQYETYRGEVEDTNTQTETYAAIALTIDNSRWRGVPMLIRTGKAMVEKVTEITVVFKDPITKKHTNSLTMRIQPHEGIVVDLRIKKPGFEKAVENVTMDFCYHDIEGATHPDAYERVLVDALRGDKTLFATSHEVLASWRIAEPILEAWQAKRSPLHLYKNGSWGPEAADELADTVHAQWLTDTLKICTINPKAGDT